MIKKVTTTAYNCGLCDKLHTTEKKAKNCLRRCLERDVEKKRIEVASDWIRLNAESPEDIFRLIKIKVKEWYDVDMYFVITSQRLKTVELRKDSFRFPIDRSKQIGCVQQFCGRVSGYTQGTNMNNVCFSDITHNGWGGMKAPYKVRGVYSGTGGGNGNGEFGYECYFFVDDFPKIKAKCSVWENLCDEVENHNAAVQNRQKQIRGAEEAAMTADHRSKCLAAEIDKLQAQIAELRKQRATQQQEIRENAHAKALLRFPQVPISADFQRKYFDLQCIFGGPTILEQKD